MKAKTSASDPIVQRLRRVDCCAVSDAMDKLGLQGTASGLPQRSGGRRVAGRVVTLKLGTGEPPPGPPVHLGCRAIEAAGPDEVIVVENHVGIEAGSWGGILTLAAKLRGVAGVVADGAVRDIDEAIAYEFPVFARSTTARTARGRLVEKGTNVPVDIGGVGVAPGDYVIADGSGVVFIRQADAERVVLAAEEIVAKEVAMTKALLSGSPVSLVMGGAYENLLQR